jgi:ribosomal protein L4
MVKNSLLVLAALAWAAPIAASVPSKSHVSAAKAKCPKAQAKATQAKATQAKSAKATGGGMATARAIAPRHGLPGEGSIFSLGRGSLLAP